MRKILFRGKRTFNGEWAYGIPYESLNGSGAWYMFGVHPDISPAMSHVQVNPETVGQYTDLDDVNGKKIFEGDIVRKPVAMDTGVVEYADGSFGVRFKDDSGQFLCFFDKCEVIGNIYDN